MFKVQLQLQWFLICEAARRRVFLCPEITYMHHSKPQHQGISTPLGKLPHTPCDSWHHRVEVAIALNTTTRTQDGGGWNSLERHFSVINERRFSTAWGDKSSTVVSDGCYPTPARATGDPVLRLQPEVHRANVSSIGCIGKWTRGLLRAYEAPVNTASHLDVNWTRGPSVDLINPCRNHSSSHKGTANLTHGTEAVKSASYPFFTRKGGIM